MSFANQSSSMDVSVLQMQRMIITGNVVLTCMRCTPALNKIQSRPHSVESEKTPWASPVTCMFFLHGFSTNTQVCKPVLICTYEAEVSTAVLNCETHACVIVCD